MPNILRDILPAVYTSLTEVVGDAITYQHGSGSPFQTTAILLRNIGDEPVKNGNSVRVFMSLAALNSIPPVFGDSVTLLAQPYRVVDVATNDYDGYTLSLRAK